MLRRESKIVGPLAPAEEDISELNKVFAESFTDRYRRDGLVGVKVPQLNPTIWSYALRDAGDGAMIWRDSRNRITAFNVAHRSGVEGWMGPLAVRPDMQGHGIGKSIVLAAAEWLKSQKVATIGLETMPRTVENIGFYSRMGFLPGHMTITMTSDVRGPRTTGPYECLSEKSAIDQRKLLEACRARLDRSAPGYDFTREHQLTHELGVGDTIAIPAESGRIAGFAVWHSVALAESQLEDEVRVLKLFADSPKSFEQLVEAVEDCATKRQIKRVAMRCQSAYSGAYQTLIKRGYAVRWTDLRMTLNGFPERTVPRGEVLLSNWEI